MEAASATLEGRAVWLAWGAIVGIVVFDLGWLLAGAVQAGGYSVASHDISDLGALTARFPWVMLTAQGIAGTLIILFALFALRPALAVPGRGPALGAWLLAASLIGLDNLSDAFSGSTAERPTRAAAPQPPSAPGMAGRISRSDCSAGSPRLCSHSSSPPGCVTQMAGATWPGRPSSLARRWSPSWPRTLRSKERPAAATCNARRSCSSPWES
jgi:hypothetical protein